MFVVPLQPPPLALPPGPSLVDWTPLEQAVAAELAYYRQIDLVAATADDEAAWQCYQAVRDVARSLANGPFGPRLSFTRFVLERHSYSLHRYMAYHLSLTVWACWFAQRGILAPF